MNDEWIGVKEVAEELNISQRLAWEMVRRLGVPMLESHRQVMKMARFRRSNWEAARDGAEKPATPRVKAVAPVAAAKGKQAVKSGLAKLRGA